MSGKTAACPGYCPCGPGEVLLGPVLTTGFAHTTLASTQYDKDTPHMSTNTVAVSDQSFAADVLKASESGPVLVDFWAEWCGPCKMIGPSLEEIAGELSGRLTVAKVDIDNNPMSPGQYGVRGIPTLLLFKDGKVAATKVGALPKGALKQWIESNL